MISLKSQTPGSSATRAGATLAAAALLGVLVAGCSTSSTTTETSTETTTVASSSATASASTSTAADQPLPDGPQIVAESAKTTQTLRAVHLVLAATALPTLPVESVDADVTNLPQGQGQAVGTANFRVDQNAPYIETEFLVVNKTMYTKGPDGKYMAVGPAERIYDPGVILDQNIGLANVIAKVQNPVVEGRETLDGVAVVKITGTIDATVIDPIVPTLGQGVTAPLPVTLWIQDVAPPADAGAGTSLPSEAESPGTGPNLVRINIVKADGNVDVSLSNWAVPVTIPQP